jgi:hypothetical protein
MSNGKALGYDLVSDQWLRRTKNIELIQNLWNPIIFDNCRQVFRARLVPLNRAYPRIPKKEEFRPITVLGSVYKIMDMRFGEIL